MSEIYRESNSCQALLRVLLITGVSLLICVSPAASLEFAILRCEGPVIDADEIPLNWDVDDFSNSGIEWGTLDDCGEDNYASGDGGAFCVSITNPSPNFDTSLESNEFSLEGATAATLRFVLNYQDFAAFTDDRLEVEVSPDGGTTWNLEFTYDLSVPPAGGFQVIGSGVEVSFNLAAYLGADDVIVRWRYYDPGVAPDVGRYVQIDNIRLECDGGADMQTTVIPNKSLFLEGEELQYTAQFFNAGSQTATDLIGAVTFPPGIEVLDMTPSQGALVGPFLSEDSIGGMLGTVNSGNSATITVNGPVAIHPEVSLDVLSPFIIAGNYEALGATFGPAIDPALPLSGLVILADDDMSPDFDACEPLVNGDEISGNIALVRDGSCASDEKVKNAQDAGAIGVIVIGSDDLSVLPFPIPPSPLLDFLAGIQVMRPSGLVTDPITIPSIIVPFGVGDFIRDNVVNSVMVQISGVDVLAQEQTILGISLADEFDPDFGDGFEAFYFGGEETNNIAFETFTVLRDRDGDTEPDVSDGCPSDPLKTTGGTCGCGIGESDLNANGIADCLSSQELGGMIARAKQLVRQLKQLKPSGNRKKDKARRKKQKEVKAELKTLLAEIVVLVANPVIPIVTVNADDDLNILASAAEKAGKKAMRTKSSKFSQNKKKAKRGLNKLDKALP